jgi:hypothetical protein
MNREILLPTYSDNSEYNADFDYFRILITQNYAKDILRRIEMLKAVQKVDSNCFRITFWDNHGDYYAGDHEVGHLPAALPLGSECNQMIIMDSGAHWSCIPKHSEIKIDTEIIGIPQLEILAKED